LKCSGRIVLTMWANLKTLELDYRGTLQSIKAGLGRTRIAIYLEWTRNQYLERAAFCFHVPAAELCALAPATFVCGQETLICNTGGT